MSNFIYPPPTSPAVVDPDFGADLYGRSKPPRFDFSGRQLHKAPPHSCDWASNYYLPGSNFRDFRDKLPRFDFFGRQLHKAPPHSCNWASTDEGTTGRDGGSNGTLASMSISLSGGALNCVAAHVGEIRHGGVRGNHMHSTCNETFFIWGARTKIRVVRTATIRFLLVDSLDGLATGCLVQWSGLFFGGACHSLLGSCYRRGLLLAPAALERLGRTWLF